MHWLIERLFARSRRHGGAGQVVAAMERAIRDRVALLN